MIPEWLALAFVFVCIIMPVAIIGIDMWANIMPCAEDFLPDFYHAPDRKIYEDNENGITK